MWNQLCSVIIKYNVYDYGSLCITGKPHSNNLDLYVSYTCLYTIVSLSVVFIQLLISLLRMWLCKNNKKVSLLDKPLFLAFVNLYDLEVVNFIFLQMLVCFNRFIVHSFHSLAGFIIFFLSVYVNACTTKRFCNLSLLVSYYAHWRLTRVHKWLPGKAICIGCNSRLATQCLGVFVLFALLTFVKLVLFLSITIKV